MTTALDRLIACALESGDLNLRALAAEVQRESNRKPGQPKAKLPDAADPNVLFVVWDALHSRRYTGEVHFVDGEPVAITRPRKESETAIANALANRLGVSRNTALPLAREVIAHLQPGVPVGEAFSLLGQLEQAQKSLKK